MAKHRIDSRCEKYKHRTFYLKVNEIGIEHFYIELIEDCPCESLEQLRKRDGHYIREMGTLNHLIAGRTQKEYRDDNKDKIKEYQEANKDKLKEYHKEYVKEYREQNKDKIKEYHKEYYETNKEDYKEYYEANKEEIKCKKYKKMICVCGSIHMLGNKSQHEKHQQFIQQCSAQPNNYYIMFF